MRESLPTGFEGQAADKRRDAVDAAYTNILVLLVVLVDTSQTFQ